jgi:hypothetical protein
MRFSSEHLCATGPLKTQQINGFLSVSSDGASDGRGVDAMVASNLPIRRGRTVRCCCGGILCHHLKRDRGDARRGARLAQARAQRQ